MDWPHGVTKKDLKIEFYRVSGAGGQHRNKADTACRMTHIPTGIVAQASERRSQHQNKIQAFRRLAQKLIPMMRAAPRKGRAPETRVRTYHQPRNSVIDHRLPGLEWSYGGVIDGKKLNEIIEKLVRSRNV